MNKYQEFFVTEGNTYTVNLADGQWVKIKTELSAGDWEDIDSQMLQMVAASGSSPNRRSRRASAQGKATEDQVTNLRIRAGGTEILSVIITAWSFDGVSITKENIAKLKEPVQQQILQAFDDQKDETEEHPLVEPSSTETSGQEST